MGQDALALNAAWCQRVGSDFPRSVKDAPLARTRVERQTHMGDGLWVRFVEEHQVAVLQFAPP